MKVGIELVFHLFLVSSCSFNSLTFSINKLRASIHSLLLNFPFVHTSSNIAKANASLMSLPSTYVPFIVKDCRAFGVLPARKKQIYSLASSIFFLTSSDVMGSLYVISTSLTSFSLLSVFLSKSLFLKSSNVSFPPKKSIGSKCCLP